MATEELLQFSLASVVVEDVLEHHGKKLNDNNLASRKAEEASSRRYEAAGWLRKMVGVVSGKDLPAEPSEEEFRLGLRSGIILCNVLNKVYPGAVPKVVEVSGDSVVIPDGAALSAFQYFENVRNFLVAAEEIGLPTFDASDLGQGGKTSIVVDCVLSLKAYNESKQGGGKGVWKFSGNVKPPCVKSFVRKNSEPFMNSMPRTSTTGEKSLDSFASNLEHEHSKMGNSLNTLVGVLLSDKNQEDIPIIVENMLRRVTEEFETQLLNENGQIMPLAKGDDPDHMKMENVIPSKTVKQECHSKRDFHGEKLELLVEQQHRVVQELKSTINAAKSDFKLLQLKYQEEVNNIGSCLSGLALAASGYQKILEENRKLYNQVQDLKGKIRVYCRVRPFLPGKPNTLSTVDRIDEGRITISTSLKYGKEGRKSFTFNKVSGPSASQEEVFADTQPLVRSVLDGYNVCIFAYGQTGSGKTYTMMGPDGPTEDSMGVNYRALKDLFEISEQRKGTFSYDISVQLIEIYNEQVRDLLATDGLNKRLEILNTAQKGLTVPDASCVPVTSTSDVIYLMNLGQKNRVVHATAMNNQSSRSHSCVSVHVQGRELASNIVLRGTMHLVDLAGSERVDKSEAVGERLKEAQHINKSLSALGDVISSLAQKNSHVPYRNSKLTQLLQDSLGGQAKTLMFVHISPEIDDIGETISTLKFAERVSSVELGAARANKESTEVKELKEQIMNLKVALARKEGEPAHLQYSRCSSPDRTRSRLSACSPSRKSLDMQDLLMNSPPWSPVDSPGPEKDTVHGDWDDKVMVNKKDSNGRDTIPRTWLEDGRPSLDMLYHKQTNTPNQVASTDDSEDRDTTTSDSSELDFIWQPNVHTVTNLPNGMGSKLMKPSPKQSKTPETRSLIPPPLTRRLSTGHLSLPKGGRLPVLVDGKRKPGSGK